MPEDPAFTTKCMAVLADDAKAFGWQFKASILTRSGKWGLVWRADVQRPNENHVIRLAVWSSTSDDDGHGVAYFGPVNAPLPSTE
jgi:hypothetical protein